MPRYGDTAYRAAPREGVGAWAVFSDNMNKLPQRGDGVPIAGRLVAQAVDNTPMFKGIQQQISEYLKKGGGPSDELAKIAGLDEVKGAAGASTFEKVGNFIKACEKKEADSLVAIKDAQHEAEQAGMRAQEAEKHAKEASAAASKAGAIVNESKTDQDSENESQGKEAALREIAKAEAAASEAAEAAELSQQRAKESSRKSGTASTVLAGDDSDPAPTDATSQDHWIQAMNGLLNTPENVDKSFLVESGFSDVPFESEEAEVLVTDTKLGYLRTLHDLALASVDDADSGTLDAVARLRVVYIALRHYRDTVKSENKVDETNDHMRKVVSTMLAREYVLRWEIETDADAPDNQTNLYALGLPADDTDRPADWLEGVFKLTPYTKATLTKFKVGELRAKLAAQGLDTEGVKEVLVKRVMDDQGTKAAQLAIKYGAFSKGVLKADEESYDTPIPE